MEIREKAAGAKHRFQQNISTGRRHQHAGMVLFLLDNAGKSGTDGTFPVEGKTADPFLSPSFVVGWAHGKKGRLDVATGSL